MTEMFNGATSFRADLGLWDVSQVTNMKNMFTLVLLFNADLCAWEQKSASTLEDRTQMFLASGCPATGNDDWFHACG